MIVRNALEIKNGKTIPDKGFNTFTQPLQFLPIDEKDEEWAAHNMDWLEWQGIKQLSCNAKRLMKNYKLAIGTIDRSDYIPESNPEMADILDVMISQEDTAIDLKFYPIIPNLIKVMTAEFAKRNTKIDYRAVDEYSYNELMDAKAQELGAALLEDASHKLMEQMIAMGMDPNSQEAQSALNPEALKKLPQIEEFYSKTYQTIGEQWAVKQHHADVARFSMDELEEIAFQDMLVADREFWHMRMMEDDYEVELWNPVLTFYHKSPNVRYISQGNWVGKIDMLTISDVIDLYGPQLNKEQLESLELLHPVHGGRLALNGVQNDGSFYDPEVSHEKNLSPSLQMKKHLSMYESKYNPDDIVSWIIGESEATGLLHDSQMLRVTTGYWKTQLKIGYLTSIDESGEVFNKIINESFVVTNHPIYNNKFDKRKTAETLVFGDHIEWIWINQTYGGIKIGTNGITFRGNENPGDFNPIYIGIDQNEISPLRFQFKGDSSVYGCKLPVEGKIFNERNTKSMGFVDSLKAAQIGFNFVNNQINDILIDEIGPVIALDHNALPQHSMGEDWGKNNMAKAYTAMKNFQMLPLDTTLANMENTVGFSHYQTLNLEQSGRLMTRIQLAEYFKRQALEVVGITPQRLGQQIGQTDTATGVEQAVAGSYAQTEMYFIQHSDYLMPRVHQMRTDVAQFYNSKKPSIRLQSLTSPDERKFFELNGTDLLLCEINVYCKTNANSRALLDQIKKYAISNNTTGASMFEIGSLLESDSLATINTRLKEMQKRTEDNLRQQREDAQRAQEIEIQARKEEKQMTLDRESLEKEKDRRNAILKAEITAAGYGAQQDINQNAQSDFKDSLDDIRKSQSYTDTMNFNREKHSSTVDFNNRKLDLEEQKIQQQREASIIPLQVARENQSKAELKNKNAKK